MDKTIGDSIYATMFSVSSAASEKLLGIKKVSPVRQIGNKTYPDETIVYTGYAGDKRASKGYFNSTRIDEIIHGGCEPRRTKIVHVDNVTYPVEDNSSKKTVARFNTVKELFDFMVKERGYQYIKL